MNKSILGIATVVITDVTDDVDELVVNDEADVHRVVNFQETVAKTHPGVIVGVMLLSHIPPRRHEGQGATISTGVTRTPG